MYILKNRVLSLFITIMLLGSGNITLFCGSVEPKKDVSQENVQGENEIVKVDIMFPYVTDIFEYISERQNEFSKSVYSKTIGEHIFNGLNKIEDEEIDVKNMNLPIVVAQILAVNESGEMIGSSNIDGLSGRIPTCLPVKVLNKLKKQNKTTLKLNICNSDKSKCEDCIFNIVQEKFNNENFNTLSKALIMAKNYFITNNEEAAGKKLSKKELIELGVLDEEEGN